MCPCVCVWWKCVHSILWNTMFKVCTGYAMSHSYSKYVKSYGMHVLCWFSDTNGLYAVAVAFSDTHEQHPSQMNTTTIPSHKNEKKLAVLEAKLICRMSPLTNARTQSMFNYPNFLEQICQQFYSFLMGENPYV